MYSVIYKWWMGYNLVLKVHAVQSNFDDLSSSEILGDAYQRKSRVRGAQG